MSLSLGSNRIDSGLIFIGDCILPFAQVVHFLLNKPQKSGPVKKFKIPWIPLKRQVLFVCNDSLSSVEISCGQWNYLQKGHYHISMDNRSSLFPSVVDRTLLGIEQWNTSWLHHLTDTDTSIRQLSEVDLNRSSIFVHHFDWYKDGSWPRRG